MEDTYDDNPVRVAANIATRVDDAVGRLGDLVHIKSLDKVLNYTMRKAIGIDAHAITEALELAAELSDVAFGKEIDWDKVKELASDLTIGTIMERVGLGDEWAQFQTAAAIYDDMTQAHDAPRVKSGKLQEYIAVSKVADTLNEHEARQQSALLMVGNPTTQTIGSLHGKAQDYNIPRDVFADRNTERLPTWGAPLSGHLNFVGDSGQARGAFLGALQTDHHAVRDTVY